jgi:hypothetical protein
VQQRRRGGVLLKVGDPLDHEPPVGRIEQRGDQVAAQPRPDHRGGEQHGIQADEDEHGEERRQQAPRSVKPEPGETDPAGGLVLGQQ